MFNSGFCIYWRKNCFFGILPNILFIAFLHIVMLQTQKSKINKNVTKTQSLYNKIKENRDKKLKIERIRNNLKNIRNLSQNY